MSTTTTHANISIEQLQAMQHAVGFFSKEPGHRNGYCSPTDGTTFDMWQQLVGYGLAEDGKVINGGKMQYFHVTEDGKRAIGLEPQQDIKRLSDLRVKRTNLYYLQELVNCGAYDSDDVEGHGFTMDEVNDFDPTD